MKLKFAIPNNPIFNDFHFRTHQDVDILLLDEKKCIELILSKRVDAAILSPFGYSMGVAVSDYRIIPGPVIALKGYTGFSSIYFRNDVSYISNTFADNPEDFITYAARILLLEKYDININPKTFKSEIDKQIENSDIIISSKESRGTAPVLDISEDWYDAFDIPLILGFWVINSESEGEGFSSIIRSIAKPDLQPEENITENTLPSEKREPRQGLIIRQWNNDIELAIEETIKLLYYHQYIKDIAAVKVFGRD